jgi:hypothetical protein
MAARSIARRSSRYSRSALLLVVAVAIAFLAATYERTWRQSQLDQVALAVPVEIVALSPVVAWACDVAAVPFAEARAAHASIDGVTEAAPVVQQAFDLRRLDGKGSFLALVPELAAKAVGVRLDLTRQPFDEQLRALIEARPAISSLALPADATRLRLSLEGDILATQAGPSSVQPDVGPIDLTASAVFRDAAGLLHRAPTTTQLPGGAGLVEIPLTLRLADGSSATPDGPLELVAVELSGRIPAGTRADGSSDWPASRRAGRGGAEGTWRDRLAGGRAG